MPSLSFILPHWLYWGVLLLFPLIAMALVAWGRFMEKHDRAKTPLNRFVCAYGFAVCYMLARFAFAK